MNNLRKHCDGVELLGQILLHQRRRRQHKHWVHPIRQARRTHGQDHRLVQELRLDYYLFQQYFWLTIEQFDDLLL